MPPMGTTPQLMHDGWGGLPPPRLSPSGQHSWSMTPYCQLHVGQHSTPTHTCHSLAALVSSLVLSASSPSAPGQVRHQNPRTARNLEENQSRGAIASEMKRFATQLIPPNISQLSEGGSAVRFGKRMPRSVGQVNRPVGTGSSLKLRNPKVRVCGRPGAHEPAATKFTWTSAGSSVPPAREPRMP